MLDQLAAARPSGRAESNVQLFTLARGKEQFRRDRFSNEGLCYAVDAYPAEHGEGRQEKTISETLNRCKRKESGKKAETFRKPSEYHFRMPQFIVAA
jgi:hypothetical protein